MAKIAPPKSKFLQVADWKKALIRAKTEAEKVWIILDEAHESNTNPEMIACQVHNDILGDKEIYDYKNKFQNFFEAYGDDTNAWIGKMLVPVVPEKESLFFVRFETKAALEKKIA